MLVTPRFHRTHHFSERPYTDSNYGAMTPWFDWAFGTYRRASDAQNGLRISVWGGHPRRQDAWTDYCLHPSLKLPPPSDK